MQLVALTVVVGLVIGPWLGIVVDRLYSREALVPTPRCQVCRGPVSGAPLVPVVSWFGRCSIDQSHRWWRYPVIDIGLAVTFGLLANYFGSSWQLVPFIVAFAVMVAVSVFDLETHLLPDAVTVPLFGAAAAAVLVLSTPNGHGDAIGPAFAGALFYGALLLLTHLVYPAGMGLGDVKLVPTLGLVLGWSTTSIADALVLVFWAFLFGNLTGGLIGLVMRGAKVATAVPGGPDWFDDDELPDDEIDLFNKEVPFGPFLVIGALLSLLLSNAIL
ncbi:MAG: A24 family peptidase [Acidimicrobiales bacterium]